MVLTVSLLCHKNLPFVYFFDLWGFDCHGGNKMLYIFVCVEIEGKLNKHSIVLYINWGFQSSELFWLFNLQFWV